MVGFKKEGVLISSVKFEGRSYAMLEDSSSQENLKEDVDLSDQVENKREDSVIEKLSLVKDIVKEQSKYFSFKGDNSKQVPLTVTQQHKEDDEEIFKKLNIPWLPEGASSFQEG